jgi:hypothetical protein
VTGPLRRNRVFRREQSIVFSLNFRYACFALKSTSSCLCLRRRLVVTFSLPSVLPSITGFRTQLMFDQENRVV